MVFHRRAAHQHHKVSELGPAEESPHHSRWVCQQIHTPKTNRNDHGSLSRRDRSEAPQAKTADQMTAKRKHTTTTHNNAVPTLCIQGQKYQRPENT